MLRPKVLSIKNYRSRIIPAKCLYWALLCLLILGCRNPSIVIDTTIKVSDQNGSALPGAEIFLNGEPLGFSNDKGVFRQNLKLIAKSIGVVSVKKVDASHYYGEVRKEFVIREEMGAHLGIEVKLFSAPRYLGSDYVDLPKPTGQTEDIKSENEVVSEDPAVKAELFLEPKESLQRVSTFAAVSTNALKASTPQRQITIYTLQNSRALAGVEVDVGLMDGRSMRRACVSNERGRCFFEVPQKLGDHFTLRMRKPGFLSQMQTIDLKKHMIPRFEMRSGLSVDVDVHSARYGNKVGIEGVEIISNGKIVGKTDRFGFFSFEESEGTLPLSLKISSAHLIYDDTERMFSLANLGELSVFNVQTKQPQATKVLLSPLQVKLKSGITPSADLLPKHFAQLEHEIEKEIYSRPGLQPISIDEKSLLENAGFDVNTFLHNQDWSQLEWVGGVDFILTPIVSIENKNVGKLIFLVRSRQSEMEGESSYSMPNISLFGANEQQIVLGVNALFKALALEMGVQEVNDNILTLNAGAMNSPKLDKNQKVSIIDQSSGMMQCAKISEVWDYLSTAVPCDASSHLESFAKGSLAKRIPSFSNVGTDFLGYRQMVYFDSNPDSADLLVNSKLTAKTPGWAFFELNQGASLHLETKNGDELSFNILYPQHTSYRWPVILKLQRNLRKMVEAAIDSNHRSKAISLLSQVDPNDENFFWASFQLGQIYMNAKDSGVLAFNSFDRLINQMEKTNSKANVSYIGAYVNRAAALLKVLGASVWSVEEVHQRIDESVSGLNRFQNQAVGMSNELREQALMLSAFYLSKLLHERWKLSGDQEDLRSAQSQLRTYLNKNGSSESSSQRLKEIAVLSRTFLQKISDDAGLDKSLNNL